MKNNNTGKKKRSHLVTIVVIEVFILLLIAAGFMLLKPIRKINHDNSDDNKIIINETVKKPKGYRNIVIFGVDSRENALENTTNSDTIIIASINNDTHNVKLASIYRDTYSNIPGVGYNKINNAYFRGGYSLALSTINKNFDLNIKDYVTVNFKAVVDTIDELGGITLDIKEEERHYLNGYVKELNIINGTNVPGLKHSGTQKVNGTQATAYARIRYTAGGDFKRTERQRIVIGKIFDKIKESDLNTINNLVDDIFPQIYTNLSTFEILDLAKDILSYDITDQTGFPFEKDAHTYDKISYVFPIDLEANVIKLHEFLFNKANYIPSADVKEYSDYIESIRVK